MKIILAVLAFMVIVGSACAGKGTLQSASAGQIGCPREEVEITQDKMGWNSRTWMATCRGKRFYCSSVRSGQYSETVSCKEELEKPSEE